MSSATLDYPTSTITKPHQKPLWDPSPIFSPLSDDDRLGTRETVDDTWLVSLLESDKGFQELVIALLQLSVETDDDEAATVEAVGTAIMLLAKPYEILGSDWADPFLTTDGFGGLRMTWTRDGKEVRAVVPRSSLKKRYIYLEEGSKYESIPGFTELTLATTLQNLLAEKKGNLSIGSSR